jgi:hypothetical protein
MLYLSLLYMLLSRKNVIFVVRSVSFDAERPQDALFVVEACCYKHWLYCINSLIRVCPVLINKAVTYYYKSVQNHLINVGT